MDAPLTTSAILAALVGTLVVLVAGRTRNLARRMALVFSLVPLALSTYMLLALLANPVGGLAFHESYAWIPSLGITLSFGLDGVSLPLFWLTTLLVTVSILFEWNRDEEANRFHALLLFADAAVLGVFAARDLFLFYVFWEATLVPIFFLISRWGGADRRYAAVKFFVYTFLASLVMLLAFMSLYFIQGGHSLGFQDVLAAAQTAPTGTEQLLFLALLVGFGVKMPLFPVHTWLPDAYTEAPTGGVVLLSGILSKMGAYGLLRIAVAMLPDGARAFQPLLYALAVVTILYGALLALAQSDYKRLVAYSSLSHMGMVLLGIATFTQVGVMGAVFLMVAHGLVSPFLFLMVGTLEERTGTRDIDRLGGLATRLPTTSSMLLAGSLASLGLPGLVLFVAEFQIFVGTWQAFGWLLFLPLVVVAITAGYYLWATQRSLFGPLTEDPSVLEHLEGARDVSGVPAVALWGLLALIVLYGLLPGVLTSMMNPPVAALLTALGVA